MKLNGQTFPIGQEFVHENVSKADSLKIKEYIATRQLPSDKKKLTKGSTKEDNFS